MLGVAGDAAFRAMHAAREQAAAEHAPARQVRTCMSKSSMFVFTASSNAACGARRLWWTIPNERAARAPKDTHLLQARLWRAHDLDLKSATGCG